MKCAVKMKDLSTKRFSVNILYLKEIPKLSHESISFSYLIRLARIIEQEYHTQIILQYLKYTMQMFQTGMSNNKHPVN